jgi:hypothetical protein
MSGSRNNQVYIQKYAIFNKTIRRYIMAKRRRKRKSAAKASTVLCCHHQYQHIWLGVILLLSGYLFARGWSWTNVLMAIGALLIAKGLYVIYQK